MSQSKSLVTVVPEETLSSKIYFVRGKRVMLDRNLAELYEVPTKVLNQAVKRNLKRFPDYFMFQLSKEELDSLRSQFVTLKGRGRHPKYLPYAFTEHGVSMLASVLNSERAIYMSIQIINTFVKIREMLITHDSLRRRIERMEKKMGEHSEEISAIFQVLKKLLSQPKKSRKEIGFHTGIKKK